MKRQITRIGATNNSRQLNERFGFQGSYNAMLLR